ncbi:alpha/beta hydrolase family protein [Vibrio parahaemolyticus]|uniref:alpha/beta hydrolase family protein n=1 Tax=Vibrio parahaemolyticus TaxID=670 RepID=UPI001A1B8C60|nr:alpha/beta hydrolase family protein [Vibrio parahaemolyticus]EHD2252478.1 alpha/beta hydrolase [Vibrio vulnificus]ELA9335920.1 alpha/beta hydrolase [Vibrio parahaemolyticus]MCX8905631.1 alpha/beta fold hydrolase [Vibrio parahaemolyticus]WLI84754.1 alpha/beta hydrolase family protein [Vibrio parahaemolyticus]HAS8249402.1 alpha/beta hydrolase [Vibrio vulnificus]
MNENFKNEVIFVAGGPGMGCAYIEDTFNSINNQHVNAYFYEQPGCGIRAFELTTLNDTIEDFTEYVNKNVKNKKWTLVTHSWGLVLALLAVEKKGIRSLPSALIALNPAPVNRADFDGVGGELVSRLSDDELAQITKLSTEGSLESGRQLMIMAQKAYFGTAENLPDFDVSYNLKTYNSIASELGDFDLSSTLESMENKFFVFGTRDYISKNLFEKFFVDGNYVEIETGHFSMLEDSKALVNYLL